MAPHRALIIHEITLMIFHAVGDPTGNLNSRRTLASLAVSCKSFSSLALDILWSEMNSFLPIFKTIPSLHISNGRYILQRTSHDQLTRFDEYTPRIHKFNAGSYMPEVPIDHSVYTRVMQLKNSALLFPSLRSLEWTADLVASDPDGIKIDLMLLLSPSLRSVEICEIEEDLPIAEAFIHALADGTPLLESFEIHSSSPHLQLTASMVCQFTHLRSLGIWDNGPIFHANNLTTLNSIKDLVSLDIDLHDTPAVPHSSNSATSSVNLPSLADLHLTGSSSNIHLFLDNLTAPFLISIFMTNSYGNEPFQQTRWRNCFEQVARRFHCSLRKINIGFSLRGPLMEVLESFLPLHNLEHIELFRLDVGYSDTDVGNIASAWPTLKCLSLPWVAVDSGRPSIAALQSVANHCPSLEYLQMYITGATLPDLESTPILSHGLRTLKLHGTTIGDPTATARYLDRLFPSLSFITYSLCNGRNGNEVVRSLHVFQDIRADQKKRCDRQRECIRCRMEGRALVEEAQR